MRRAAAASMLIILSAVPALASSVTVNWDGTADSTNIEGAVLYAVAGGIDSVLVAPGTYVGDYNTEILIEANGLVIQSIDGADVTIIEGGDVYYAFRFAAGVDSTTVLRGFTFDHCYSYANGGAIQLAHSSPTIDSCVFEACGSNLNGGAMYSDDSSSVIRDCVFASNSAAYRGGAVLSYDGGLRFNRCVFRSNTCSETYGGSAAYVNDSADVFMNCIFVANQYDAIGLYFSPGALIKNCVFFGTQSGAAVENVTYSGDAEITHCISYANSPSDSLPCYRHDNLYVDPLFCGVNVHDYTVCYDSQCLPDVNAWNELIGAFAAGCPACDTPVEDASWGSIKALYRMDDDH